MRAETSKLILFLQFVGGKTKLTNNLGGRDNKNKGIKQGGLQTKAQLSTTASYSVHTNPLGEGIS